MSTFNGLPFDEQPYSLRAYRNELYRALDRADAISDERAETDINDLEARREGAHGLAILDDYVYRQNIDPKADPWYMFRRLSGENIGRDLAAERGVLIPFDAGDPPTNPQFREFVKWANAFDSQIIDSYLGSDNFFWSKPDLMAGDLREYYGDNRDVARIRKGISAGLSFGQHADRMLAIIKGSEQSLDIGMFQMEEPTIISAIADRITGSNPVPSARVHLHTFDDPRFTQKTVAKLSRHLFRGLLGNSNFTASEGFAHPDHNVDHFKLFAQDIRSLNPADRAFLITSANVTAGALGKIVSPGGDVRAFTGSNLESSFLLDYSLVQQGRMTEDLFNELTRQAADAADWVKTTERSRDFGSFRGSGLLDNAGFRRQVESLLRQTSAGGRVQVFTANLGQTFLGHVKQAILRGGQVEIVLGSEMSAGGVFTTQHDAVDKVNELMRELRAMDSSGAIASRLQFTAVSGEFIHTNMMTFDIGGRKIQIQGSNRLSEAMYGDDSNYRNLSIMLEDGQHYNLTPDLEMFERMLRVTKAMSPLSAGLGVLGDEGVDGIEARQAYFDTLGQAYGLGFGSFTLIPILDRATGQHGQYIARATVGQEFTVRDSTGRSRRINLGGLMSLTMTTSRFGYSDQIFIPELSKFIGPTAGIGVFGSQAEADAGQGPKIYSPFATVAAALKLVNEDIQEGLNQLAGSRGVDYVAALLKNPRHRAALSLHVKQQVRDTFKNFAGFERGTPAFEAKGYARMLYLRNADGTLSLRKDPDLVLDAKTIDASLSGMWFGRKTGKSTKHIQLAGQALEFVFSAGALARFGKKEASTARVFDLAMVDSLPMAARMRREGSEVDEYLFMLPAAKLEQLPQRLQNILAARNLTPISLNDGSFVGDKSRIASADGRRMEGLRVRMLMIPGMGGDNSYMIHERMGSQYFADGSFRREANIESATVAKDSMLMIVDEVRELVGRGPQFAREIMDAQGRGTNRFVLTREGLDILRGRSREGQAAIGIAKHFVSESLGFNLQELDLKVSDPQQVLILDLEPGRGVSIRKGRGKYVLTVTGQLAREAYSGDRTLINVKAPIAFLGQESRSWTALEDMLHASGTMDVTRRFFGGHDAMGFMGSGTIKYGQAFLETGVEVLGSGVYREQLEWLVRRGRLGKLFGDSKTINFAGLFNALEPFMEAEAVQEFKQAIGDGVHDVRGLLRVLDSAAATLTGQESISLGTKRDLKTISAASLAFGVHALFYTETQAEHLEELNNKLNPPGSRRRSLLATEMTPLTLLGAIPLSYVTALSASAVAMSSRDRVNFLNYHAGGYTDAFFDLMALDKRISGRADAFRELVMGGLLESKSINELFLAGREFNVMSYFMEGLEDQFAKMLKLTRELQGHGGKLEMNRIDQIQRELHATLADIEAQVRERTAADQPIFKTSGSMSSAYTQSFLRAQEKGGVSTSRTLLVPEFGFTDEHGIFQYDLDKAQEVRMRQVRFLSPKALRALGSFEDFSHEIQQLQVEIESKVDIVRGMDPRGKRYTMQTKAAYDELMGLIMKLEAAQRGAAATELQKVMGGQLAMAGKNMIAGVLPELPTGWMLLGEEPWQFLKEGIKGEIVKGLRRTGAQAGLGSNLLYEASKLLAGLEDVGVDVAKIRGELTGKAIDLRLWNEVDGWASPMDPTIEGTTEWRLKQEIIREAKLNGQRVDFRSGKVYSQDAVQSRNSKAATLMHELRQMQLGKQEAALDSVLEMMLGDINVRAELTRGIFQRAGAPMGPIGMLVTKIMLVDEYNAMRPAHVLNKDRARRAMFIFPGAMAFNLGDFDGDTASVSWLQKFSELNAMRLIEARNMAGASALSSAELARINEVERQLNFSTEELNVRFARYYTGWDTMFSDERLYLGEYKVGLRSTVEARRDYLHELESRASTGVGLTGVEETELSEFRKRKSLLNNLATASNKYVADIYELQFDIAGKVTRLATDRGISQEAAYTAFFNEMQASDLMAVKLKKSLDSMTAVSGGGPISGKLEWRDLVTFFSMTSYASTLIMGKVFEAQFISQQFIDRRKARETVRIKDLLLQELDATGQLGLLKPKRELLGPRDIISLARGAATQTGRMKALLAEYSVAEEAHSAAAGMILVAQQMAREAIKPKGEGEMLAFIKRELENLGNKRDAASAVAFSKRQTRVIGLNAWNKIIEGTDLSGEKVFPETWGMAEYKRYNQTTKTWELTGVDEKEGGWDKAYHEIREALLDYYQGQIDAVYSSGLFGDEAGALFGLDADGLSALFGTSQDVENAKAELIEKAKAKGLPGDLPTILKTSEGRELLKTYVQHKTAVQALNAIDTAVAAGTSKQARSAYLRAVNTGNYAAFNVASGMLGTEEKLNLLQGSTARGKLSDEGSMRLILEDIFDGFVGTEDAAKELRSLADRASTSATFSDQIVRMFEAYKSTGSMRSAIRRAAEFAAKSDAELELANKTELARIEGLRKEAIASGAATTELDEKVAELSRQYAVQKRARETQSQFEQDLRKLMPYKMAAQEAMAKGSPLTGQVAFQAMAEAAGQAMGTTTVGKAVSGGVSNVLIPAWMMSAVGGLGGLAANEAAGHGGLASSYGEFAAMAVTMSNPIAMVNALAYHEKGKQAMVRSGMALTTFMGAAYAAHKAGAFVGEAMATKMGLSVGASQIGALVTSGVVGMAVGVAIGAGLEALAIKGGYVKAPSHAVANVESLFDLANQFLTSDQQMYEEEQALTGDISEENTIELPDGTVLHEHFYVTHSATRDAAGSGSDVEVLTDPDTFISHMTFESFGNRGDEGLFDAAYGA